jgi:hypothetical protein
VLGIELRVLYMLIKYSTTELHPQPEDELKTTHSSVLHQVPILVETVCLSISVMGHATP